MKVTLNFLAVILTVICLGGAASGATYFTANLTGAQEVPPTGSSATGFGRVTLNDAETQITASFYYGNPTALGSNVVAGHIHGAAAPGVNAPILFNMNPTTGVTSGSVVNATFAVTPQQVADLKAGLWYFNVHTVNFPGGEIRGQILVDAPYVAYLNGAQENPAVATAATGSGVVSVNTATNQAIVTMNWSGLSGNTTASHYHSGRSGVNGPVICNFNLTGQPTAGSLVDFLCNFTGAQITALRQGQLYLNIHTAANPGGEVRGQIQRRRSTVLDFDGDSKTDYVVTRNDAGNNLVNWFILNSASGFSAAQFGNSSDFVSGRLLSGDFDGDGKDDITIWRSGAPAFFYILQSATNTFRADQFGTTGDDPRMIYDYDGDGRTDIAVYRPGAPGVLYYIPSANNPGNVNFGAIAFGTTGDFPNPGDFDGDGRGDICVQRSTNFFCQNTSAGFKAYTFGLGSDFSAPGDYDGDGKTDITVVRTSGANRVWFTLRSSDGGLTANTFGTSTAARTQGDYDGDGKTDVAVWQNTGGSQQTYFVLPSNGSAFFSQPFGLSTDISVNAYNVR